MKKALLLSCVLLALTATVALAGGLNLTWGANCFSGVPVTNQTWTCTSNLGTAFTMTGSVQPNTDIPDFFGYEVVLDAQTLGDVPPWWQGFNTGACRQNAFSPNGNFLVGYPQDVCFDPFGGLASGGMGAWQTALYPPPAPQNVPAPDRIRVKIAYVLTSDMLLEAAGEFYAFSMSGTKALTTGGTACAGCATPVTFVLNQIICAATNPLHNQAITNPLGNQCITAFGGAGASSCSATPARNTTWGQVKGLYR